MPARRTALVRAWYLHRTATGDLAAHRRAKRAEQIARFGRYLEALDRAGAARVPDAVALAEGVYAAIDGVMRQAIIEDVPLERKTIVALATIVLRAIFGPED